MRARFVLSAAAVVFQKGCNNIINRDSKHTHAPVHPPHLVPQGVGVIKQRLCVVCARVILRIRERRTFILVYLQH
jgi:hypothetical protein